MQRLWLAVGTIVTVPALGLGTYAVVSLIAHEHVTERTTFEAAGVTAIDLDGDLGDVDIVGSDVDEITMVAEIDHGLRRTRYSAEIVRSTLVVRDDCPTGVHVWCRVDYELVVPADGAVHVRTGNGRVAVRDVDGPVSVDSGNGALELRGLTGDLQLLTRNGRISGHGLAGDAVRAESRNGAIRLGFVDAPTSVGIESRNGSVEVVVPDDDATYRVDVTTRFTGASNSSIRTDPESHRSIVARTHNGSVTLRYPTG